MTFHLCIHHIQQAITVNNSMSSLLRLFNPVRLGIIVSALVLTGCATTQSPDSAQADALVQQLKQEYAYSTQSDPLGAYLANRAKSDVAVTYHQPRQNTNTNTQTKSNDFASTALNFIGVKYRYGGSAPQNGFDCSGLVSYAAEKSLGLKLPRRSAEMARLGTSIKRHELQEGDLVFFNTNGKRFSHVGIYLGDNKFVHSPRTGASVRVEDMTINYWKKRYNGARRLASNS